MQPRSFPAARAYVTFNRIGKVVEKIIEDHTSAKRAMWSIVFRESEFFGDFHESLLETLVSLPAFRFAYFHS